MSKKKSTGALEAPKSLTVVKDTIEARVKNEDFGGEAVRAIGDERIAKLRKFVYKTTIDAVSALDSLKLRIEKINKPDVEIPNPTDKIGEFTYENKYSAERARDISASVKAYNALSDAFTKAMSSDAEDSKLDSDEREETWKKLAKATEEALKHIK